MKIKIQDAEKIAYRILQSWNICAEESYFITENLIEAELVGRKTHGLARLQLIKHTIDHNNMNISADPIEIIKETPVSLWIDGRRRSGFYVISKSLELAYKKVATSDLVIVGLSNTAPSIGLVSLYARKSTQKELIFIGFSNCEGGLIPFGLKKAIWGTNPFTVGIPTGKIPVILDMASSSKNWGEIYIAQLEGRDLPYGIAADEHGHITTKPQEAINGGLLPFAEHKGSGLAFVIELLAGALTGSRAGYSVKGGWGTLYILINPLIFGPLEEFQAKAEIFIQEMKSSEKISNTIEVCFPGEQTHRRREASLSSGYIDISDSVYRMLISLDKLKNGDKRS
jgi:LDH2 family malate/lactate/ureidoglycolate dehydrogenase